jgi:NAD(P)-dependent dehydrogenase (short-subunit alcohol dehydrogenase family)
VACDTGDPDDPACRAIGISQAFVTDLAARVVLVTGASGGLGGAVVRVFLDAGARVAAVGRSPLDPARLGLAAEVLQERILAITANVEEDEGAARMVQETTDRWGRVDVLVSLVGGYQGGTPVAAMEQTLWDQMVRLNLTSTFLSAKHVFRQMEAQGGGAIITVGTRAAIHVRAGEAAYAASKAGMLALTQVLAEEGKERQIRVNAVLPSVIDTPANRQAMPKAQFARWVKPEQLAQVILFLASDSAADITGAWVPVYGRV